MQLLPSIFFYVCKKYAKARNYLMNKLLVLHYIHINDAYLLLWGNSMISTQNQKFFKIEQFFSECGRFSKLIM